MASSTRARSPRAIASNSGSHALATASSGRTRPTHITPGTADAAFAARGPPIAVHESAGTISPRAPPFSASAAASCAATPARPSVTTRSCEDDEAVASAPRCPGLDHTSSSSSSSRRSLQRGSRFSRSGPSVVGIFGRSSPASRVVDARFADAPSPPRGRGLGDVSRGLVPFASAASSSSASTARRAKRATPTLTRRWGVSVP
mmetsp:Transcript_13179/g.57470  ORF Transcript_13179/g.57470 Transcript_13179/m.57470 type:complete len:203 (+) Transcript_13179:2940-3548(+)